MGKRESRARDLEVTSAGPVSSTERGYPLPTEKPDRPERAFLSRPSYPTDSIEMEREMNYRRTYTKKQCKENKGLQIGYIFVNFYSPPPPPTSNQKTK